MTKHQDDTAEATPSTGKRQRIAKLMARVGLCSRRDAEAWIRDGRVSLNGEVLTSPAIDVEPDDDIRVDGAPLPRAEKTRLFLFHKPRGLVTSDHDPEGRATVADFLRENWPDGPRVVTIGRLDINTEGLLLLTNDGGLARTLELPQTGWLRRYRVRAKGTIDQPQLDALIEGISIDGVDYAGIEAKLDRTQGANCWLTMGLREGKNREIKRVLEHLGLEVNRLIRLSFGPFQLGDIEEGAVEEVRTRVLRDQLGPQLAAEAGVDLAPQESPEAAAREPAERDERPRRPGARQGTDKRQGMDRRRADAPRGRRGAPAEEPPPRRERPVVGPRRHVSVLRDTEAREVKVGPRKRIERTDTKDRNDRVVQVERRVSTRPAAAPLEKRGRAATAGRKGDDREALPSRGDRPRHMSPSALGKRARMERSGGEARRHEEMETGRPPRREREPQRTPRAGASDRPREARTQRSDVSGRRGDERFARPDRTTTRPPRQSGERSGDAKRPRPEGAPRQRDEAPRRTREAREAPRPERGRSRDAAGAERQGGAKRFERPGRAPDREATPRGGARERGPSQDRPPRRDGAPGAGRPNAARPNAAKPSAERPSAGRSGVGRPSAGGKGLGAKRPGGGKPGGGKPGGGKPSGFKPGGRPGGARPSGDRPGGGRSGGGRPGGAKPGRPKPRG